MKNRRSILLIIILMVVGFAAVSTTLFINGQTKINPNQEDFNVYYSDAYVNGKQDKSVIIDDTHIVFETELLKLGEKYVLDYEVTNGSKNYDAELVMECTGSNEYLTVTNEFDDETILKAKALREGKLTLELTKSNAGEDVEVTIACTIKANAIERDSLGIADRSQITVEAVDSEDTNLNAKAFQILGNEEEKLLNSLVETGYVSDVSEVDALIEVKSDEFDSLATTTFDVSSIANEGDKVVILHFNESTQEWEYISEETVDANGKVTSDFTSYSPVAFVVKKEDGTITPICSYKLGQTFNFTYKGSPEEFTVECNGKYKMIAYGANGGAAYSNQGGGANGQQGSRGNYLEGEVTLSKNDILTVYVGQGGENAYAYYGSGDAALGSGTFGYGKGGTGLLQGKCTDSLYGNYLGSTGSGGGATAFLLNGTAEENRLLVAGGGGGAGSWSQTYMNNTGNSPLYTWANKAGFGGSSTINGAAGQGEKYPGAANDRRIGGGGGGGWLGGGQMLNGTNGVDATKVTNVVTSTSYINITEYTLNTYNGADGLAQGANDNGSAQLIYLGR